MVLEGIFLRHHVSSDNSAMLGVPLFVEFKALLNFEWPKRLHNVRYEPADPERVIFVKVDRACKIISSYNFTGLASSHDTCTTRRDVYESSRRPVESLPVIASIRLVRCKSN